MAFLIWLAFLIQAQAQYPNQVPPNLETSLKYFNRMAIKPNAHKAEPGFEIQRLWILIDNAKDSRVQDLVRRALLQLATDEACTNCDLFFPAFLSDNRDLQAIALNNLHDLVMKGGREINKRLEKTNPQVKNITPAQRWWYYFDRFYILAMQSQNGYFKNIERSNVIDSAAQMLTYAMPPDQEILQKMELRFFTERNLASAEIIKGIYAKLNTSEELQQKISAKLNESLSRLEKNHYPDNMYPEAMNDISLLSGEIQNPLVQNYFLNNFENLTRKQFQYQTSQVFAAVIKSQNKELLNQAVQVMSRRIRGEDAAYESYISNIVGNQVRVGMGMMMNNEWFQFRERLMDDDRMGGYPGYMQRQVNYDQILLLNYLNVKKFAVGQIYDTNWALKTEEGKAIMLYSQLVMTVMRDNIDVNFAADLFVETVPNIDKIEVYFFADMYAQNPNRRRLAIAILKKVRGQKGIGEFLYNAQGELYEMGLKKLKNFSPEFKAGEISPDLFIRVYKKSPPVRQIFAENLAKLINFSNPSAYMFITAYLDPELKPATISLMNQTSMPTQFVNSLLQMAGQEYGSPFASMNTKNDLVNLFAKNVFLRGEGQEVYKNCLPHFSCVMPREFFQKIYIEMNSQKSFDDLLQSNPNIREQNQDWIMNLVDKFREAIKDSASNQSAFPVINNEIANSYPQLLPRADDPKIKSVVTDNLESATLRENQINYRGLWILAFASDDKVMQEKVMQILRRRILGEDEKFNQTLGRDLKTVDSRLEFYFGELLGTAGTQIETTSLATYIILNLGIDKKYYQPVLERILSTSGNEIAYKVALEMYENYFGEEKISEAFAKPQPVSSKNQYVIVNGGYSEVSNYVADEIFLQEFHYGLFHSKSHVLNAGGEEGKSIDWQSATGINPENKFDFRYREPLKLPFPGENLGFPKRPEGPSTRYQAATLENTKKLLKDINLEKPEKMTVAFVGHGSPDGFVLWGRVIFDKAMLNELYKKLFPDTQVRTIIGSCFAGAMVATPSRLIPNSIKSFESHYVEFEYPKNKCALALTSHLQLRFVDDWGDWKTGSWSNIFARSPNPSLEVLRSQIFSRNEDIPVITSDYFLEDLRKSYCAERTFLKGSEKAFGSDKSKWPQGIMGRLKESWTNENKSYDWDTLTQNLCDDESVKNYEKVIKRAEYLKDFWLELSKHGKDWTEDLIKTKFLKVYEAAEEYRKANFPELKPGVDANFLYPPFEVLYRQGSAYGQYEDFFAEKIKDYRAKGGKKLDEYLELAAQSKSEHPYNLANAESWRHNEVTKVAAELKTIYPKHIFRLRQNLEPLLKLSLFPRTANAYNSIRACETSALYGE